MATSDNNKATNAGGRHEQPQELNKKEDQKTEAAHEQAEHDIEEDADLSIHSPNDDLDEGETARLGDGKNDLI